MAEICFQNVAKRFGSVVVIENLSLLIKDKEFFTFVGPSGCGKSTILNMTAGLEQVTRGNILFDGISVNTLSPGERDVAVVFQSYALYPHMSVYENIAFPLKIKKTGREVVDREVKSVAAMMGIGHLLNRRPKELSGGQKQRVALGRAIIRRPKVFLMDEPLSNLDARLRVEMRTELKRLHQELQITTIYVTHDQEEAMVLSDRVAVLFRGKIQQCAKPMEIYMRPANLFVAGFVGSPPMNILDGKLFKNLLLPNQLCNQFASGDIIVGMRPSDVSVSAHLDKGAIEGEVLLLEPTGDDIWVDVVWRGQKIKGRAGQGEQFFPGQKVSVKIPLDKLHIFDKTTEKRLSQKRRVL